MLVSAHTLERDGVNAIPEVLADELGRLLDLPVDSSIVQTNVVSHTGADGFSRLTRQAAFAGEIVPGFDYLIVDDFVGQGGTLANLRGFIESQGEKVIAPPDRQTFLRDPAANAGANMAQNSKSGGKPGSVTPSHFGC